MTFFSPLSSKLFFNLLLLFITLFPSFAQNVSNVFFMQKGMQIEILYDLTGAKFYETFNVEVYVSTDGGFIFEGPLQMVEGEVGDSIMPGRGKKILWNVLQEYPIFEVECGMHLNYKYWFISAGVASPNFEWAEATLSVGFTF